MDTATRQAPKVAAQDASPLKPLTKKGIETRATLLDSTIALLASQGYAATTTQAVLDHASISRGSLLHQFRTRDLLMVAAAIEAVDRMFDAVQVKLLHITDPIEALRQYPDVLWEVQNEAPARAFAELQLAARWETTLQQGLKAPVRAVNERISRELHDIAQATGLTNVDRLIIEVGALISAMQGLAVSSVLIEDEHRTHAIQVALAAHYRDCLEASLP